MLRMRSPRERPELDETDEETPDAASVQWLGIVMEEYRTLRREIVASLAMGQSALQLGTFALGGLTLAGLHDLSHPKATLPLVVFLLLIPLISYVSVFIWLGEYARATRAGEFLVRIEQKVNEELKRKARVPERPPALSWERWLRTPEDGETPQYAWNSWISFLFFMLVVPLASIGVGNVCSAGLQLSTAKRVPFDIVEMFVFLWLGRYLLRVFIGALEAAGATLLWHRWEWWLRWFGNRNESPAQPPTP